MNSPSSNPAARPERTYTRGLSVDNDSFDTSLTVYTFDRATHERIELLRVPVEEIPGFLRDVTIHGLTALSEAAERLEVGHCETCANTRLVTVTRHGRPTSVYCPDCKDRAPDAPFKNAPQIGQRGWRPPTDPGSDPAYHDSPQA